MLSLMHDDIHIPSEKDCVDVMSVTLINVIYNSASNVVFSVCFTCYDQNDHGYMEIDHGLAPGAMVSCANMDLWGMVWPT